MKNAKQVSILGRKLTVCGDPADRYFREYVRDGESFSDAPIAIANGYCNRDAVIIDVGANIGLSTLAFAQIASGGTVIAYEPSPSNFELLKANIELSGFTNVQVSRLALSDQEGVLNMVEDKEFMAGNRIDVTSSVSVEERVVVRATTLDAEIASRGIRRIDLLKIDVEGHEKYVLDGARRTLETLRPICVLEFNSYTLVYHQGASPGEFLRFVSDLFPVVYYFDRKTFRLRDLRGHEEQFLKVNSETGFVDDLVGAYAPLPLKF